MLISGVLAITASILTAIFVNKSIDQEIFDKHKIKKGKNLTPHSPTDNKATVIAVGSEPSKSEEKLASTNDTQVQETPAETKQEP